jgi:FkbM family methyltransferase
MKYRYYSQISQDRIVDFALSRKTKGVFLDIGAYDGVRFSNTYFFETERDWTGICIDPNPDIFQKLITNRCCICENCAIATEEKQLIYRKVKGKYFSEMLGGILEFMKEAHIERINREVAAHAECSIEDIPVECKRLDGILDKYSVNEIDYLSLDTEGAEYEILQSLDFDKLNIRLMSVERNKDSQVYQLLSSKGYKCCSAGQDAFYYREPVLGRRIRFYISFLMRIENLMNRIFKPDFKE